MTRYHYMTQEMIDDDLLPETPTYAERRVAQLVEDYFRKDELMAKKRQQPQTPEALERRFTGIAGAPVRVTKRADGATVISGYAAVFYRAGEAGTEFELWSDFRERIMPGAFDAAIKENHDCRGLFNHDPSCLLGRRSAGTLKLSVDAMGLMYEITAPDTQAGRDVVTSIERGDLTGSSFAFIARRSTYVEEGEVWIRQVEDLELFDVGPVTYPAYEATTTGLRSRDGLQAELDAAKAARRSAADEVAVSLARIALDQ